MTSVFASIPLPKGAWRSKDKSPKRTAYAENTELHPDCFQPEPEEPDLRDLNASLQALTEIFPDIEPEVFREMLGQLGEESRLQVVTESLLKNGSKWVRGRYRIAAPEQTAPTQVQYKYRTKEQKDTHGIPLSVEDKFRNENYKTAVKTALYQEFKGLSHSTIRAVLAEYNYSYTQARPTLLDLRAKSWRYTFTSLFSRRKAPNPSEHPLITWRNPDPKVGGLPEPRLTLTGSHELNKELYDVLIAPLLAKRAAEQEALDRTMAEGLNDIEAEEAGAMYDCECCYTPSAFEQISTCTEHSHYICYRCIRHSINEALYGQGWARSINIERSTLRCIAPLLDNVQDCQGCIPLHSIHSALISEPDGETAIRKLQERCTGEVLQKSRVPLVRCPFCTYAEIDDITLSDSELSWRLKNRQAIALSFGTFLNICYIEVLRVFFRFLLLFAFFFITLNYLLPTPIPFHDIILASRHRIARKRRGLRFTCQSPLCLRSSCLNCHKEWRDVHICHEASLLSLRKTVEAAMANAVKRTCPLCNISFVKDSGCNKLTCVCGYQMCYVCRQEIGKESYGHFCQHFRTEPGKACTECEKCDLYRVENEEELIRRARNKAESDWRIANQESGVLQALEKQSGRTKGSYTKTFGARLCERATWEGWLDTVLDAAIA